jgi:hypothetical protein
MSINYLRRITEPFRNLVKRYAPARQEACESSAHGMGCDPRESLRAHMIFKWAGEVITRTSSSVFDVGSEHKWLFQTIMAKETKEPGCEWYGTLFPIFEVDRGCFSEVQQPRP